MYWKILCLFSLTNSAAGSVLELPQCLDVDTHYQVERDYQLSISSLSDSRKSAARSFIECIINCVGDNSNCISPFFSNAGACYHLDYIPSEASGSSVITGMLAHVMSSSSSYNITSRDTDGNCNGGSCPAENMCINGCGNQMFESPVCLAQETNCTMIHQYSNTRHYWGNRHDNLDSGELMIVLYPKHKTSTGIRVILDFEADTSGSPHCNVWYFTFNGDFCDNPGSMLFVDVGEKNLHYRRAANIDGICYGIGAGDVDIRLHLTTCPSYTETSTSTNQVVKLRSLIVMEVEPQQSSWAGSTPCQSLSTFNHKYELWNGDVNETFDTAVEQLLKEVDYVKIADDSLLRIKYNAVIGINTPTNDSRCGQWKVKISNGECSTNGAAIEIVVGQPDPDTYWDQAASSRTLEVICDNQYNRGAYKVQIYMGQCLHGYTQPTNFIVGAGLNVPSSLHIEEVRLDQQIDAVEAQNGQLYRSAVGYISHQPFSSLDIQISVQHLVHQFIYVKKFADTSLRLTASGSHGLLNTASTAGLSEEEACTIWYFEIEHNICQNPGDIAGIVSFNQFSEYRAPLHVSGVCHDLNAGTLDITFTGKPCDNGGHMGLARVGYASPYYFYVEELRFEEIKDCGDDKPIDCTT